MILLDTHALLWWRAGGERLSRRATRAIATPDTILISPVSFWETAMLLTKGRIALDRDIYQWVRDVLAEDHVRLAPLSAQAATTAGLLTEFPGDPADRMLYATAGELDARLVTKDRALRDFSGPLEVTTVW